MEIPQVNLVMQAEQWKARLAKEEESYVKGREIRLKETEEKIKDCRSRCARSEGPPQNLMSVIYRMAQPKDMNRTGSSLVHIAQPTFRMFRMMVARKMRVSDSRIVWQGRPPISISSVCFDTQRPSTQQTIKTQSTGVSMTSSEYRAHVDRMDDLEVFMHEHPCAGVLIPIECSTLLMPVILECLIRSSQSLQTNLAKEKRARLAAERELQALKLGANSRGCDQ